MCSTALQRFTQLLCAYNNNAAYHHVNVLAASSSLQAHATPMNKIDVTESNDTLLSKLCVKSAAVLAQRCAVACRHTSASLQVI